MSSRTDELYLDDILDSIAAIEEYIHGKSYDEFTQNRMAYSATIRELEIIGEAISKISKQTKEKNPQIDYRTIKDFRNVLAHQYFGVDMEIVWDIINEKLPRLKSEILDMTL